MSICPHCMNADTCRNGHHPNGKQKYLCCSCRRQFVHNREQKLISESTRKEIRKLLLQRLSLRSICRLQNVSLPWLLKNIWQIEATLPKDLNARFKGCVLANIALDEQWSFVGKKANRQWLWLVFCPHIRQVLAMRIGERNAQNAKALLAHLPDDVKKKRPSTPANSLPITKCSPISNIDLMENSRVLQPALRDFIVR